MSHDIDLTVETVDGVEITVHEVNFTYNYTPALNAAGLHWSDFDGHTARDIAGTIRRAHHTISEDPEKFRPLIKGEGQWGTPEDLIPKLDALATACETHPSAKFARF